MGRERHSILIRRGVRKMSKSVKFLYKLARTANDVEKLASGDSKKIAKRAKNKILGRTIMRNLMK